MLIFGTTAWAGVWYRFIILNNKGSTRLTLLPCFLYFLCFFHQRYSLVPFWEVKSTPKCNYFQIRPVFIRAVTLSGSCPTLCAQCLTWCRHAWWNAAVRGTLVEGNQTFHGNTLNSNIFVLAVGGDQNIAKILCDKTSAFHLITADSQLFTGLYVLPVSQAGAVQ